MAQPSAPRSKVEGNALVQLMQLLALVLLATHWLDITRIATLGPLVVCSVALGLHLLGLTLAWAARRWALQRLIDAGGTVPSRLGNPLLRGCSHVLQAGLTTYLAFRLVLILGTIFGWWIVPATWKMPLRWSATAAAAMA
eukprot:SAG31_NODE_15890_length_733_cov_1.132492_1_plen_139_part_10